MLVESRIRWKVYVRFGGESLETCYSNMVRRRVLSLRLKAQFIWYLSGGLVGLLILFAVMYFLQFNTYLSLAVIAIAATVLFTQVYKLSNTYGEHGMMKRVARRGIPNVLKLRSRKIFMQKK